MNRIAFICLLCLLLINVATISAQEKSILDGAEIFFSLNRTTFFDYKTENRTGFGAYFGVGYRIPVSRVDLIIKPDYKFVFNRINSQDNIYNRYLRFNVILKFN